MDGSMSRLAAQAASGSTARFMTDCPVQKHACPASRASACSPEGLPGEALLTPFSRLALVVSPLDSEGFVGAGLPAISRIHHG